ncbi:MAG: MBL fold metallo-hydrolase [Acidimicrobiales bacterium]
MAQLSFYGGVGRIGSTKVVVEQDGWRALFDLGLLVPGRDPLLHPPVHPKPGTELAARLRLGEAPRLAKLYRPDALRGTGLEGGADGRTALFVSHCHIDHMGLLGWVDPAVPIYASPETAAMVRALESAGQGLEGGARELVATSENEPVEVGPLRVERVAVDHDVPGASGYLVRTDDGTVAYSGDLRLHGRHPERSLRFAECAAGAAALVVEGTTLSGNPAAPPGPEARVEAAYSELLACTPGLVLLALYPRDIERVEAFVRIAAAHGREVLWPAKTAAFLAAYGLAGVRALDEVAMGQVRSTPAGFAVQVALEELDRLLDLPLGPGSVFVHANGEPLGPFQRTWDLLQAWLAHLKVPFYSIGTSGHATPADLDRVVDLVGPATVYPVHTADPYRLLPPPGTRRVLPELGRSYPVGRPHRRRGAPGAGQVGAGAAEVGAGVARSVTAAPVVDGRGATSPADAPGGLLSPTLDGQPVRAPEAWRARGTVCVDLDSTLADTRQRHHLVLPGDQREDTDWVNYSLACANDEPIEGACQLVRLLSAAHRIVIVSRRDEAARQLTLDWLGRHGIPFDELILGGSDGIPSGLHEFKVHHLRSLLAKGERVVLCVDDLPGLDAAVADARIPVPVLRVQPPYSLEA